MNPICCNCNVEMWCDKNGVFVYAKTIDGHEINVRKGDRYKCPECKVMFMTGLGEPFKMEPGDALDIPPNLKQIVVV